MSTQFSDIPLGLINFFPDLLSIFIVEYILLAIRIVCIFSRNDLSVQAR